MITFKEHYQLNEGKDEAAAIRQELKTKLGLSATDVSVKASYGGYSSSVNITIKTMKALVLKKKIEDISNKLENYDRDQATGEILMGGNTYIFINIGDSLESKLSDAIHSEFEKQTKGVFEKDDSVILFGTFHVGHAGKFIGISLKQGGGSVTEVRDIKYIGSAVLQFIRNNGDYSLYSKIKGV